MIDEENVGFLEDVKKKNKKKHIFFDDVCVYIKLILDINYVFKRINGTKNAKRSQGRTPPFEGSVDFH